MTDHPPSIVLIASDPWYMSPDLLEEEAESIRKHLTDTQVTPLLELRRVDIEEKCRSLRPNIIHFTGFGSPTGQTRFESTNGKLTAFSTNAARKLAQSLPSRLDALVFGGCKPSGRRIYDLPVPVYIAARAGAFDLSLEFSTHFYAAIAAGSRIPGAFEIGVNAVRRKSGPGSIRESVLEPPEPHFPSIDVNTGQSESYKTDSSEFRDESSDAKTPVETITDQSMPSIDLTSTTTHPTDSVETPIPSTYPMLDSTRPAKSPISDGVRVYFGTNRAHRDVLGTIFDSDRSKLLHLGYCDVFVPKGHKLGSLGTSWFNKLLHLDFVPDRLRIVARMRLSPTDFETAIATAASKSDRRSALLFIHGYSVGFDESILRGAQISYDLNHTGVTAVYSWPSKAKRVAYTADEATADTCCSALTEFIELLTRNTGVDRVNVIAHSMGNRTLLRTVYDFVLRGAVTSQVKLGAIFLAAPDVDAELFGQLASAYPKICNRTTLYASARDKALCLSGIVHDFPRAGFTPPITVIDGIDTVQVANVDLSFLGHSYVAEIRPVLADMHAVLNFDAPPANRMGLRPAVNSEGRQYWIIGR